MRERREKPAPEVEPEERQPSFFELVVPKKAPEPEPDDGRRRKKRVDPESLTGFRKFWYHLSNHRAFRLLIFCLCAVLVMFLSNRLFGVGNQGFQRTLAPENGARIIVFPHCTYELLESDITDYPGVIGAVAAYDEQSGDLEGYAYDLYCTGEGGEVLLTLGIRIDGTITGLSVTAHKETRGLGTSAGNLFIGSFAGRAADEDALDEILYMDSTPDTSAAIVDVVKQAVRHAHDHYGIVGHSDEALQQSVSEDIRENNTYDSPELRALLPGATFAGYYPDKGYPMKGFQTITMAYIANLNGEEYYAYDITTTGADGDIALSVAVAGDQTIASIQIHSQQESAFEGNDILSALLDMIVGCDKAALSQLDVDGDARYSGNAIINAAVDAIDCTRTYFLK